MEQTGSYARNKSFNAAGQISFEEILIDLPQARSGQSPLIFQTVRGRCVFAAQFPQKLPLSLSKEKRRG
jgi:hypothetical protein